MSSDADVFADLPTADKWHAVIKKRGRFGYWAHYTNGLVELVEESWALTRRGIERRARRTLRRRCLPSQIVGEVSAKVEDVNAASRRAAIKALAGDCPHCEAMLNEQREI